MADIPVNESTAETVVVVTANGQTAFAFDFLCIWPEQMTVIHERAGVETVLDNPAQFSVAGLNQENGGTVTLIGVDVLAGDGVTMRRVTPIERVNDWQNEGDYKAALVNAEQDIIFMILQELARDNGKATSEIGDLEGKAIVAPGGYSGSKTLPSPSPDRGILWNADGSGFKNSTFSEVQLKAMSDAASLSASSAATSAGVATSASASANASEIAASDSQVAAHLSEMNARAAADATGPVIFFDSKADADAAASGLDENAIVEVLQDEDHYNARTRYRVESSALDLKIYLDILALPNIAALQTLWGLYDGQVARVVSNRQFGHFKWRAGNLTAEVASDPYQGLWVAPSVASNGSLGAWQRMVEKGEYDAEWWLPVAMPTNAQVRINAAIDALPNTAGRFLFPRREVLTSGSVRLTKGIVYEGFSDQGRINGQGGQFYTVIAQASNALLKRIKAGNVAGQVGLGEPGGFHVNDGATSNNQSPIQTQISNVGLEACETFDAETGLRFGYSSYGSYPDPGSTVAASHDCWATDFRATGIERIGIEYFWAYDIEVRNPRIRMKAPVEPAGFDRGMRLANARKVAIIGGALKGPENPTASCHGLSCESASMITFEGVRLENFVSYTRADKSEDITISNCKAIGWDDTRSTAFFTVVHRESGPSRNIHISDCSAINVGTFAEMLGTTHGFTLTDNYHLDNEASSGRHFLYNNGYGIGSGWVLRGNRHISGGPSFGQGIRLASWPAGSDLTWDDNIITGVLFAQPGDGEVRSRSPNSNRSIDTSLWATVRPPVEQGDY